MADDNDTDSSRRDFLGKMTAAVGGVGAAASGWVFIASMNPSRDIVAQATVEVDLSGINEGESRTVAWQGKPIFILHRTAQQVETMQASEGGKDPEQDKERVKQDKWLVVVGSCTHLGCVPNTHEKGWFCPCHGSIYDFSGRVLGGPAPRNLEVPPYQFLDDNKIVIGKA